MTPNFYYPTTWNRYSLNGMYANYVFYLCPKCSAIVEDQYKHLEWHKSIKDDEQ